MLKKIYTIICIVLPIGVLFPQDPSWRNRLVRLLMLLLLLAGGSIIYHRQQEGRADRAQEEAALIDFHQLSDQELLSYVQEKAVLLHPQDRQGILRIVQDRMIKLQAAQTALLEKNS